MESAGQVFSVHQIADLVVERLLSSGTLSNLGVATLDGIEEQTILNIDQVTRDVISKLLGKQAELIDAPQHCPKCGGGVVEKPCQKPSQGRSLQSRRGSIQFKTDVVHCEACRLDFFPSVQNTRL